MSVDPLLKDGLTLAEQLEEDEIDQLAEAIQREFVFSYGFTFDKEEVEKWFSNSMGFTSGPIENSLHFRGPTLGKLNQYLGKDCLSSLERSALDTGASFLAYVNPDLGKKLFQQNVSGISEELERLGTSSRSGWKKPHTDGENIYLFPARREDADTPAERLMHVLTWKHNGEIMEENGISTLGERYNVVITEIDGEKYPVMVSDLKIEGFVPDHKFKDRFPDTWEEVTLPRIQNIYDVAVDLIDRDMLCIHSENELDPDHLDGEYYVDVDTGEPYVADVGELSGTYADFLEETGIRDQVERHI